MVKYLVNVLNCGVNCCNMMCFDGLICVNMLVFVVNLLCNSVIISADLFGGFDLKAILKHLFFMLSIESAAISHTRVKIVCYCSGVHSSLRSSDSRSQALSCHVIQ